MTKSIIRKILFIFTILSCCTISLLAQVASKNLQNQTDVFKLIDVAFLDKNPEQVSQILASTIADTNYAVYEEYVLQKTRSLLLSNQLDLIQSMCMAIIDNNLDNIDAVNLYTTVEKSVAKRNAKQKAIVEQRQAEAEYVAQASETKKEDIRKDYNIVDNSESGQTLFVAPVVSSYYSDFTWSAALNIAELGLRFAPNSTSVNYGIGLMGDFYYRAPRFSVGADLFLDAGVLNFTKSDLAMSEISLVPGLSFVKFNEDLFFRLGFGYMTLSNGNNFVTPVLGVSLKNIKVKDMRLGFYADYYLGHFATDNVLAAFGFGGQSAFNLGTVGNINLAFFVSFREALFIEKNGIDSRTRISLGFGVENNE